MDDTIVAVRFAAPGEARRAIQELKQLDRDGRLRVREAALEAFAGPLVVVSQRPAESFRGHGGPSPHDGEREVALEDISRNLEPGVTLVVAEIADPDPDVLDSTLAGLGTTVTRRAARDVYAELQAAHGAERTAS